MVEKLQERQSLWRRRYFRVVLLLAIIAAWLCFSIWVQIGTRGVRRVILISIDTCRADHLGCYGFSGQTTPNIDAIANEGIVFENVVSPVPLTLPAHCSMLTGTVPPHHGVHDNFAYWLGHFNITLAEVLKETGFSTAAFVSAFVMDSEFGLDQGFGVYQDDLGHDERGAKLNERRAGETTAIAMEWLERHRNENFFVFLHYYDPHSKYEPPEPFATTFADDLYSGEIAYTDYWVGQVTAKLKELGLFDSCLLVITSDHGEMLGEHGEKEHGYFIYQGAIKVPLIFKLPGQKRGRRVKETVGLVDIMPTICSLAGVQTRGAVHGEDLSVYFANRDAPKKDRDIYIESLYATRYGAGALLGVVSDRWKYIQTSRAELYDLTNNEGESRNLTDEQPALAQNLRERLKRILDQTTGRQERDNKLVLDEVTRRRLESLGYVGGVVEENFEFDTGKEDPKDLIDFHSANAKAIALIVEGRYAEARDLCQRMAQERPDVYVIYSNLARIAYEESKKQEAIGYMFESLRLKPEQAELHSNLGMLLAEENRQEEAIAHLRESLRLNPNQAGVHFALGNIFDAQGRLEDAAEHYTKVLEIEPGLAAAHNNLGSVFVRRGRLDEAFRHCIKAIEIDPNLAEAQYNLGNVIFMRGRFNEAVMHYEKALQLRPDWPEAEANLKTARERMQGP